MQANGLAAESKSGSGGVLGKAEYQQLRAELSFAPSFAPTLAILLLDALLLRAVTLLLRDGQAWSFLLSQLLLAVVFFNAFAVLHECGHGSASRYGALNTIVGHLVSGLCLIPYYPWKYIHQKHHAFTGNVELDPVLKSLRTWRDHDVPFIVRIAWWSWIPLGALLQHVVYLTYPLTMWRNGELTRGKLLRTLASLAVLPASYAAFALWAPELVRPGHFAMGLLLFLVAEELVNIPHHVDVSTFAEKLPIWEQYRATRSCYYPPGVSELLVLNFNFHTEHHLFPNLPWYRLRRARALVKRALGERYQEAVGIGWNIDNRRRDLQRIVSGYRGVAAQVPRRATQRHA